MAGSVNKVILVGNLGRDPEVRSFQNGGRVANFSIATGERWRDRQTGEQRERTEWHRIAIYDEKLVEIAEKYLRKGEKVYLEGELQTRKWTDQSGQERYTTEVALQRFRGQMTMLGARGDAGSFAGESGDDRSPSQGQGEAPAAPAPAGGTDDFDDDIPF